MKPISPQEVAQAKAKRIPEPIIRAFNDLIAKNWDGEFSVVFQVKVIELAIEYFCEEKQIQVTREKIFQNNWLDIEEIYRNEGWKVIYDRPSYCENYEAYFKFCTKND
jgi:hypothetical protein